MPITAARSGRCDARPGRSGAEEVGNYIRAMCPEEFAAERQLQSRLSLLRRNQREWNLRRVYWFSVDDQRGTCNFCDGSGLFAAGFRPKPSWHAFVRFAGGTP